MGASTTGWNFLIFFLSLWLGVTTLLTYLSGWFRLMRLFPDRPEKAYFILRGESGSMGIGVHFGKILVLSACPSGLRVGVLKIFGPFARNFLVPWNVIRVVRYRKFFQDFAELRFGDPEQGRLVISQFLANTLASAAGTSWSEPGPLPKENRKTAFQNLFKLWLLQTALASVFFTLVPRMVAPPGGLPPVWVGICFPAVVFGIIATTQYFLRRNALKKAGEAAAKALE